jgi:hypothetical protein
MDQIDRDKFEKNFEAQRVELLRESLAQRPMADPNAAFNREMARAQLALQVLFGLQQEGSDAIDDQTYVAANKALRAGLGFADFEYQEGD